MHRKEQSMARRARSTGQIAYPARIYQDPEDPLGGWVAHFPGLGGRAGIATQGDTQEEARANAQEALTLYLEASFERGWDLPEPAPLPAAEDGWELVEPEPTAEVALLIRRLRHQVGLTQQQAAERIGVPATTYSRWEHPAKCNATIKTLDRVAAAYGRRVEIRFAKR